MPMDRYVLLIKAPKGYNIEPFREKVKELAKNEGIKAELHRCIGLTVDIVIIHNNGVVLIKRKRDPYRGFWAIPGGFVEYGESVEEAAVREAKEETGLDVHLIKTVGVYSDPSRDPRGHTVSVAFLAVGQGSLKAGDDAGEAKVFDIDSLPSNLAFDHSRILSDALRTGEAPEPRT